MKVKNTFAANENGTLICPVVREEVGQQNIVTGIAKKKDFLVLFVHKTGLNVQKNIIRKILSILEYYGVPFEHMPSSIDAVNFYGAKASFPEELQKTIVSEIRKKIKAEDVRILKNTALVSVVGRNMASRVGVAVKIFDALVANNINIRMILQGCREINVIIGIDENKYEAAIKCLYDSLLKE